MESACVLGLGVMGYEICLHLRVGAVECASV